MKKRNISDSFEEVYLRFNTAKRDLARVDPGELSNPEFKKVCNYITSNFYKINEKILESNGYAREDVFSLAMFFGACYLGHKERTPAYTDRAEKVMMISYINQRLIRFVKWTHAKFQVDERVSLLDTGTGSDFSLGAAGVSTASLDFEAILTGEMYTAPEEELEDVEDALRAASGTLKVRLECRRSELKSKITAKRKESRTLTANLRAKMEENPEKHEDELVYYAYTKHVAKDVRRAAKRCCEKYGIDHKNKIKCIILDRNYSESDFVRI